MVSLKILAISTGRDQLAGAASAKSFHFAVEMVVLYPVIVFNTGSLNSSNIGIIWWSFRERTSIKTYVEEPFTKFRDAYPIAREPTKRCRD